MAMTAPHPQTTQIAGRTIQYRAAGSTSDPPVLLLHGWPTSSFLWRNVMPVVAKHRHVIAVDLPGFGGSDKPLDVTYDFAFFADTLDAFTQRLDIDEDLALAVHDLGGPVGLYWAMCRNQPLERLAICNTAVYPDISPAVTAFLVACRTPVLRRVLTSQAGLRMALVWGVSDARRLPDDAREGISRPYRSQDDRRALLKTATDLETGRLEEIADWLPSISAPVSVIWGPEDRILPEMSQTARRLERDIPDVSGHPVADCGHFLQEERPGEVGRLLSDFVR